MGKTCYEIERDVYYFNNPKFIELVREKFPIIIDRPKQACSSISADLRREYSALYHGELDDPEEDIPGCEGIYGWYHKDKKNGLYTSPRNIRVIDALAKLLDVNRLELLTKSHNVEIQEISEKKIDDISDPLEILIYVVMDYVRSTDYNYIPGTNDEGHEYYTKLVQQAENKVIEGYCTAPKMQLIESIYSLVNSCEGFDAVDDYLLSMNPCLSFFCSPFEIMEESIEGAFNLYKQGIRMKFIPTMEQIHERKKYFDIRGDEDRDVLFMKELSETIRRIYTTS
jgi:hypothetical protein